MFGVNLKYHFMPVTRWAETMAFVLQLSYHRYPVRTFWAKEHGEGNDIMMFSWKNDINIVYVILLNIDNLLMKKKLREFPP